MKRLLLSTVLCLMLNFLFAQDFVYTLQSVSGGNININCYGSVLVHPTLHASWSNTVDVYLEQSGNLYHCGTFTTRAYSCPYPSYTTSILENIDYGSGYTPATCDGTSNRTATIPIPTSCVPSATYNIRLAVTQGPVPPEWPLTSSGSITVGSYWEPVGMGGFNVISNIGTTAVTGGSSFTASVSSTHVTCSAFGSITFNMSGTAPYTMDNSSMVLPGGYITPHTTSSTSYIYTGLAAGTYHVYVKDANGCRRDFTVTINPPTMPTVSATKGPTQPVSGYCKLTCIQLLATPSTGTGYSYQWKRNGVNINTNQTFCNVPGTSPTTTTYSVTISNTYGCTASGTVSALVNTSCTAATSVCCLGPRREMAPGDSVSAPDMKIYPNPAADVLNIEFELVEDPYALIEVVDATGKVVQSATIPEGATCYTMGIGELPAGFYLVRIISEEQELMNSSFIKE